MRLVTTLLVYLMVCACMICTGYSQEKLVSSAWYNVPDKFFTQIDARSKALEDKIEKQTENYLKRLSRQEKKLKRKLWKKDSAAAKEIFGDIDARYDQLQNSPGPSKMYNAYMDTMRTALSFIGAGNSARIPDLNAALNKYNNLQRKLDRSVLIKQQLKERQQYLKQHLRKFGLTKQFKKYQQEYYYYRKQLDEYRKTLEDPTRIEKALLAAVHKIPAFRDFFNKHSELATLFPPPPGPLGSGSNGLQSRTVIQSQIQSRIAQAGTGGVDIIRQNIANVQAELKQLKEKIGAGDPEDAEIDFKPNSQRTKPLKKRFEYGGNFQTTRSNTYFPVTSDLALSLGYKLNDKSVIGVGASCKVGLGQNIRNIKFTYEGVGLRTFLDYRLKGNFFITGGYEADFQRPTDLSQLAFINNWQESALLGLTKKTTIGKLKTKVQLLYDVLTLDGRSPTSPIRLRFGYNF